MIHKALRGLRRTHVDERGANIFVTLAIMFGLLLLVPLFVDFASLHFSHRISQTGADTAAHAAAVEFALWENWLYSRKWPDDGDWDRFCGVPPEVVVEAYRQEVVWHLAGQDRGYAAAAEYARRHQSTLEEYLEYYESHTAPATCKWVFGVDICPLAIYAKTRRPVPLIYESAYGGSRRAPAEATAETYLHRYDAEPKVCDVTEEGKELYVWVFKFWWKVRLISTVS